MLKEIICAGFGGQGIITTGILISYCAFETGNQFTWYPSYGAQMRGGTANCTIKISDKRIASPLAKKADILVGMSGPAIDKFEASIKPGGYLFVNTSTVGERTYRDDINVVMVDTAALAEEAQNPKGANMVMIGAIIKKTGIMTFEGCSEAIDKYFTEHGKAKFNEANQRALKIGYESV